MLLDAIKIAKEKEDPSNILRGAEQFIRIMDMLPKKTMQTDAVQIDMTSTILDKIAKEEKKSLTLSQKKEIPYEETSKA
jgi:DNA-directed RNA polymerase subunit F